MIKFLLSKQRLLMMALMLPVMSLLGQNQEPDTTAIPQIEEVTIIGDYSPIVKEAFKIRTNPVIPKKDVRMPAMSYTIQSSPVFHEVNVGKLKPLKLKRPEADAFRKNYLKLGFGNFTTPYIEFFANMEPSSSGAFGVHLKHLSSSGDIKDYAPSAFSNNLLDIFGKKIWRSHVLTATAGFKRDVVHNYGFHPDDYGLNADDMDADTIKQQYMQFSAGVDFESTSTRRYHLHHAFSLRFYNLSDDFETTENCGYFRMDLDRNFKIFEFSRYQRLGLNTRLWFYNNKISDSIDAENTFHVSAQPFMKANWDEYRLKIGADIHFTSDSLSDVYVFPLVEAGIQVMPGVLELYASYSGGIERNSFRSLSSENPWVSPMLPLGFTKTSYRIRGGVAAKILPVLDLNVGAEYSLVDNMPFFITDPASKFNNEFTIMRDEATVLHLFAESHFKYQELIGLSAGLHYRSYTMDALDNPWYKPEIIGSLGGNYRIMPELQLSAEIIYRGKQYAAYFDNTGKMMETELDGTFNLNVGAEYFIYEYFTAFLKVNNALGDEYQRYYNYPTQGINVMGGISFSF